MKETNWKGIPTKKALYFPEKGGRKFGQKIWEPGFRWTTSDLIEFLFPRNKMPIFHEVAVEYVKFLLDADENTEDTKKEFCQKRGYSYITLRQHIIPKLYRFGLIHRSRELPRNVKWSIKSKRKSYEHESLQFSTMMRKMADEWEQMVETSRSRRQKQGNKEKEKEREIERLERIEWAKWEKENG